MKATFNPNKRYHNLKNFWGGKTMKTMPNEYTYLNKKKNKEIIIVNKSDIKSNRGEKMFNVTKKKVKTKINNISEDIENKYYMPNL